MNLLGRFTHLFGEALRNLAPIVVVVLVFQALVLQQVPEGLLLMMVGLGIVVLGVALFLLGLELAVFPIGKTLADELAARGSLPWLMIFGFCLGFGAVVAEPALIAVADQAQLISGEQIDALTLRMLVAASVGLVVAVGVLRIVLGLSLHWMMIIGYTLVVTVTFFSPPEIVGLAYDSGGVTTNIVTVPLIAALGLGLAAALGGRNPLMDGFGLVALAVMVPMIAVQIYGILVFTGAPTDVTDVLLAVATDEGDVLPQGVGALLSDLGHMIRDVIPIAAVILGFQYLVIRRRLPKPGLLAFGFVMVIIGLYAFVVGLKLGLFPIGRTMAEQLMNNDQLLWIYVFAFAIGYATTMAEPALIAIGKKAEQAASGRINGGILRHIVAIGVAIGITIGVHRIIAGDSIHQYIMVSYALVIVLTLLAPRYIVALAYDLGGVTTSEVTVPLITALGIGLATQIEGRNVLIDGFGLIAFASIFPIVSVMLYAILADLLTRFKDSKRGAMS